MILFFLLTCFFKEILKTHTGDFWQCRCVTFMPDCILMNYSFEDYIQDIMNLSLGSDVSTDIFSAVLGRG